MDRLVFGMHHLNISQSGTLIDGQPNLSHPNYALDLCGSDTDIDFYYNKEDETFFFCTGAFGTRATGNTRFFVTCDSTGKQKTVLCADGKERVVTLAMTHSGKDFIIGKLYAPNAVMYQEGTAGKATGNHIHLEVSEGYQKTKYWDTKLKVYRMKGEFNPLNAFFILDGYTTVVSTHGLNFKHTDSVKVEDEEMIYFKPIKDNVRLRSNPVNGTVLTYIWTGNRAEVIGFTGKLESDGYEWVKVRYGKFEGYCQMDMKMYVLEK